MRTQAIVLDSGKWLFVALKDTSSRKKIHLFIKELAMFWNGCLHSDFSACSRDLFQIGEAILENRTAKDVPTDI